MLYTVAYPELSTEDRRFIDDFRHAHDLPYRDVIAPHFTMVFGCSEISEQEYCAHVGSVAAEELPIEFCCRYAMLGADAEDETAYVFLVPDEGHAGVALLHDRLYSGILAPYLRLDVPYTPHITIGTLSDRHEAKELCDHLNERGISVAGRVSGLTVGLLEGRAFEDIRSFTLGRG